MKRTIYILMFLILMGCGQSNSKQTTSIPQDTLTDQNSVKSITERNDVAEQHLLEENQTKAYKEQSLSEFEKSTTYRLTDTIRADFNGDGFLDKVIYKKENETSGIIFIHGKTKSQIKIGFGKMFAHMTDFNWVDYWGLFKGTETDEVTFNDDGDILGSKKVKLQNVSIFLGKDEAGGGLITFKNGDYVWIHQAD